MLFSTQNYAKMLILQKNVAISAIFYQKTLSKNFGMALFSAIYEQYRTILSPLCKWHALIEVVWTGLMLVCFVFE